MAGDTNLCWAAVRLRLAAPCIGVLLAAQSSAALAGRRVPVSPEARFPGA